MCTMQRESRVSVLTIEHVILYAQKSDTKHRPLSHSIHIAGGNSGISKFINALWWCNMIVHIRVNEDPRDYG
jgi:hypothetical protein